MSCIIKNCNSTYKNATLFGIPVSEDARTKWIEAIARHQPFYENGTSIQLVCVNHFQPNEILPGIRKRISPSAVPSIFPAKAEIAPVNTGQHIRPNILKRTIPSIGPATKVIKLKQSPQNNVLNGQIYGDSSKQDPPTENIKIVEINRPSNQQKICLSCIKYKVQLQAAHAKNALLEQKLSRLQLAMANQNGTVDNRIGQESPEDFTHLEVSRDDIKLEKQDPPIGHVELVSIDEIKSNDLSMLPTSLLNDEIVERYNESIEKVDLANVSVKQEQRILKPFQCARCDMSFELLKELRHHVKEVHEKKVKPKRKRKPKLKPIQSLPEKTTISGRKKLSRHVREVHEENRSTTRRKKEEKSFQCYLCRAIFSTAKELRVHMERHERDQKCEICKTELTLDELSSHLCGEKRSIGCEYCSNEFTITLQLVEHLETAHENKKLYKCEKCPIFFASIGLKEFHMKSHEHDAPRPYVCKVCSRAFAKKILLRYHTERHTKIRPHLCDECGRSFASARSLDYHKNLEHNERSHVDNEKRTQVIQCPDCPKTFFQMDAFKRHNVSHRENKDKYVCRICQAELQTKKSYSKHIRKHQRTDADRKYACPLCDRKFFSSNHLKCHQKVHISVRSFSCKFCKANYKYKGDLNKHLKTHLGPKIHECPKCFELFEYKDLQKHEIEHYKEEKRAKGEC
ncbi:zinc finger protein 878-like [Sitodiplosis mosellana]|uniref:zinc finger protein 878-like n=1 Tax=Sitodiplosis mosellana TaxID=263140 RepID=UPI002444AB0D|nr:zinc finger protein 878-like [Sitodiplosis mosellana]XP_055311522.1 zinc finger protein 878-like [Sitodiplosis mosellana]